MARVVSLFLPSWPTDRLRRAHHAWLDTAAGARKTHLERCRRSGVVGSGVDPDQKTGVDIVRKAI